MRPVLLWPCLCCNTRCCCGSGVNRGHHAHGSAPLTCNHTHACRYTPGLAAIFGVTGLSWEEWRIILALSAPVVAADELLKAVSRQLERPGGFSQLWGAAVAAVRVPNGLGRYAVLTRVADAETGRER